MSSCTFCIEFLKRQISFQLNLEWYTKIKLFSNLFSIFFKFTSFTSRFSGEGPSCRDRPCFPGVACTDVSGGYRCGPCPRGFAGDGITCRPEITCRDRPCYNGMLIYHIFKRRRILVIECISGAEWQLRQSRTTLWHPSNHH